MMKRPVLLLAYQTLTGLSDTSTGLLLMFAPRFTLHLMDLQVAPDALIYVSYIGAFVLSVGLACLYGALLLGRFDGMQKLETVWVLTALTRGLVALFVAWKILSGALAAGWASVAISDGLLALLQCVGFRRGWLADEAD